MKIVVKGTFASRAPSFGVEGGRSVMRDSFFFGLLKVGGEINFQRDTNGAGTNLVLKGFLGGCFLVS